MSKHCSIQNDRAVCAKHKSEVCGVCCSDYVLFNRLKHKKCTDTDGINKAIQIYFKKPKKISQSGGKQICSPHLQSLLAPLNSNRKASLIDMIAVCGYTCFSCRFSPQGRSRITNILRGTLETAIQSSLDDNAIDNEWKKERDTRRKDINNRKKQRQQKLKAKRIQKQNELKKKGIRSKQNKYKTSSYKDKVRNKEIDMIKNMENMFELLSQNGCTKFGSFFEEIVKLGPAFAEANNKFENAFKGINITETKADDMIQLNDSQLESLQKGAEMMQFMLKYGCEVPMDDPKQWTNDKINTFLRQNNIVPRPKPSRDVLVKVCKELIKLKSKMMHSIMNMPENDEASKIGRKVLLGESDPFSDNSDCGSDMRISVNAQIAIPNQVNPCSLKSWTGYIGVSFKMSMVCLKSLKTKVFKDMAESMMVIAESVDKYKSIEQIPAFIVQNKEKTHALCIMIVCVQQLGKLPMIVVKYFKGERATTNFKKQQRMVNEMGQGRLMQEIPTDLMEVQLMTRLLKKNRKKLLDEFVRKRESKLNKGWKISVFVPYRDEKVENECPSCHQLASLRCSRCRKVCYCSVKCQKIDWKLHKKLCKKPLSL
eukprot:525520_1